MSETFTWQDTSLTPPSSDSSGGMEIDDGLREYRTYQSKVQAPEWLQGPAGKAWYRASGDRLDALAHRAYQAIQARYAGIAPPDAMTLIGQDRVLERNDTDTDEEYATRLRTAWGAHQDRGTVKGCLDMLAYYGYDSIAYSLLRKYWLDSGELQQEASTYYFDNPNIFWSKILFIIPAMPSENERLRMITAMKKWKSALSWVYLCFVGDALVWDYPEGTWAEETLTWAEVGTDTPIIVEVK